MNANRQPGVADKKTIFYVPGWCENGFDLFISGIESFVGSIGQMAGELGVPNLSRSAPSSRCWCVGQLSAGWMKSISGTSVLGSVFDLRGDGPVCWGSLNLAWERIFRQRVLQRGVSLLTENRDDEGSASTAGWPPDRPGWIDIFHLLVVSLYRLKEKKIPAGRVALGDWLGWDRVSTNVGIFAI